MSPCISSNQTQFYQAPSRKSQLDSTGLAENAAHDDRLAPRIKLAGQFGEELPSGEKHGGASASQSGLLSSSAANKLKVELDEEAKRNLLSK